MDVTCENCGKAIRLLPCEEKSGRRFCSRACRSAAAHRPVTCIGCGVSFPRSPQNPKTKYCTWECFKSSRHVKAICGVCGKEFKSYLSEQRKREERNHVPCCSRDCRNRFTSLLLGGDGQWVEGGRHNSKRRRPAIWRKIRQRYLESVGYACEGCGQAEAVEVHHLVPTAAGGDLIAFDNLMAVCKDCHANMHDSLRSGKFQHELEAYIVEIYS